ncbi:signal peptidase, putative [Plasmodium knowlesi strain H]|uniref:Signal peptidase, putative n=3 Tax=Plasmodium knowlesi TaxID=5850 RepID=A0A5K1V0I8_PLAKH|nr:signal peptidase, putative [Plasmodium knowlesi strain H]OTN63673.1 putative Signal peptidase [Plasmodium knowlesi]CAA9990810.1 signal peptidase, putative [Plasmodium knowlesi strain H]SBO21024.1 signal peptidase, putative [Plasmodium knowlesi strain H]SBO21517.1 signal peptidase, putative [Plasmodium knowlesi strain H]VVS80284.1 signal peptidase, putative [Plasmodium knowlesi strain H]|eukprot:XP_002262098.1 signal peptidase, putative [Plasmodium knowlesi strain H]
MNRSSHYVKRSYALIFLRKNILHTNSINNNSISYHGNCKGEHIFQKCYAKFLEERKRLQSVLCRSANACNFVLSPRSRGSSLKCYSERKKRGNNKYRTRRRNFFFFNFVKINNPLNFIKKIILSFLLIFGINNYVIDMTLTSGSSMCPLINKNGVILFYVCDDTVRFIHQARSIFLYSCINLLLRCYALIGSNIEQSYMVILNNKIFSLIEKLKRIMAENKHVYRRGDVILLTSPVNEKKRVCKRIIAIGNDKLFVDNIKAFVHVPKDNVWVEGDNKMDSFDSRNYGFVHMDLIIGRVIFLLDPFINFRFISNRTS